jgi:hypothetical protein
MTSGFSDNISQNLTQILGAVVGGLQLPATHPLCQDIQALCGQWSPAVSAQATSALSPLRIAVFGPFNYGKSTLLNAILGERALPIDLIPTTGAAIRVRYGEILQTRIRLADGQEIVEAGTEVLKQFAILDEARRMRSDVIGVEVTCSHPFLKLGVELVDLPGTNDREAQDDLVRAQLLTADLVVQVLDGRKLMTLGERENLRDWLLDRGITTVMFVVNFLNLLEPEEQRHVYTRLRFVAESFRADLPPSISNLYRVDALPALRARLKGDAAAAQEAGLPMLETALQAIATQPEFPLRSRLPRLKLLAQQAQQVLRQKITALETEQVAAINTTMQRKWEIQQQAQQLLKKGFEADLDQFRRWLALDQLLATYQLEAAVALQSQAFCRWERGAFKTQAIDYQQALVKWVQQACEFFERSRPNQLLVVFPSLPQEIADRVAPPEPAPSPSSSQSPSQPSPRSRNDIPFTIATGLGWVLGGPMGAAILGTSSYALNRLSGRAKSGASIPAPPNQDELAELCRSIAAEYLRHFSRLNLANLDQYAAIAQELLAFPPDNPQTPVKSAAQEHQLRLLRSLLEQLEAAIAQIT